jgi:anti-sigma regulatory factor (Ser/Thr protein kinase)
VPRARTAPDRGRLFLEKKLDPKAWGVRRPLIAVVAVAVLAAAGVALAFSWRQYGDSKNRAAGDLKARAILAGTVFDTYFAGQLAVLNSIAESPAVRNRDVPAMERYFARVQPAGGKLFTGGIGWINMSGVPRASSNPGPPARVRLADRSYFKAVLSTGRPFISEAIRARVGRQRLIVMAVPTHDPSGNLSGVLTGAFLLQVSRTDSRAIELGYAGLQVLDRKGQQLTLPSLARPSNGDLQREIARSLEGVLVGTKGLDGTSGRVVAYATSAAPGWKIVIDQPESAVFASARRVLAVEVGSILGGAAIILALIIWVASRARRDLRSDLSQVRQWARLTRALGGSADQRAVCEATADALASHYTDADVVVALRHEDDLDFELLATRQRSATAGTTVEADAVEIARAVQNESSRPRQDDLPLDSARPYALPGRARGTSYGAPLFDRRGNVIGALALLFPSSRGLGEDDQLLIRAYADQTSQAVTRVRRQAHEHEAAVRLQRSLLPAALPDVDGLELGACYRAGAAGVDIGGDWYDAVRRPDGIVHLTVGDVAGRGIPAAILMGQLRNAFRAYALEHTSPAAILGGLSRHTDVEQMATAFCVAFDPFTNELTYASAGHPPALLIDRATLKVVRLDQPGRPPLGWQFADEVREWRIDVPARAALVLYTDGLIERRSTPIDAAIDQVGSAIVGGVELDVEAAANATVDEIVGGSAVDDVALLLVETSGVPATLTVEIPSDPSMLADLRRRLRRWLLLRGIAEQQREDTVLAVSEAVNNSIEHAYRDSTGTVTIRMAHSDSSLELLVEDQGAWREPITSATRGRGLRIIRNLMESTDVSSTGNGTRVVLRQKL